MSGIVDDLLNGSVNDILGVRDDLGVALKQVHMVTRSWSGLEPGDGEVSEVKTRVLPSPRVVEFKNDLRIVEGGAVQQGDILLKQISKQTYPTQDLVDGSSDSESVEKFYEVGHRLYRVVAVTEKQVTWTVLLRPLTSQERPLAGELNAPPPRPTSGDADPI